MLYEHILRPILFHLDPETAHETAARVMLLADSIPGGKRLLSGAQEPEPDGLSTEVFGIHFSNPVGLAAGFDKDGLLAGVLPALGFGFLEVGSITLKPQPGNPRPRIFRVPQSQAIINRLGFNSAGAGAAAARLKTLGRLPVPLGINLGLNAGCPKEEAAGRYAETFKILEPYGDYFAVNVSSPNTPGLRALQERLQLERILLALKEANTNRKPILVKIDPDHPDDELPDLVALLLESASGVIASNTTVTRPDVPDEFIDIRGGLSGAPLRELSTRLIKRLHRLSSGRLPIIGVGGIFTGIDAYEKIRAGASLVQLYTGLIYRGPAAIRGIRRELADQLSQGGYKTVAGAVGTAAA